MEHQRLSTSSFKRFLSAFLLPLILMLAVGGVIFQYIFEKNIILKSQIGGAYKVNRIIKEFHPQEIPMFGSSRMIQGLIPDTLGPNYFNYGLNGTAGNVIQFFLTEELNKKKTTPIIINLDIDGLRNSTGDLLYYLYNVNYKPVKTLLGTQDKWYYHVDFIKYFGNYEYYLKDYLSSHIALTKFTDKGASVEKNMQLPDIFAQEVKLRSQIQTVFFNEPKLLLNITNLIVRHPQRKLVFVIAPCHPSCFKRYKNEAGQQQFLSWLKSQKNVSVFNFSKDSYPDSLFFDTEHVNFRGAIKYSLALRDSLAKIGIR